MGTVGICPHFHLTYVRTLTLNPIKVADYLRIILSFGAAEFSRIFQANYLDEKRVTAKYLQIRFVLLRLDKKLIKVLALNGVFV